MKIKREIIEQLVKDINENPEILSSVKDRMRLYDKPYTIEDVYISIAKWLNVIIFYNEFKLIEPCLEYKYSEDSDFEITEKSIEKLAENINYVYDNPELTNIIHTYFNDSDDLMPDDVKKYIVNKLDEIFRSIVYNYGFSKIQKGIVYE